MAPREGEQLRGQLGAPLHRRNGRRDAALYLGIVRLMTGQQVQVAGDHLQKVVEIVGDAAGQPADGFELLRLAQLLFGGGTRLHFGGDALLQVMREFLAHSFGFHMLGGLVHDHQDPGRLLVVIGDGAVGQVHPDLFRHAVTQQLQRKIAVGQGAARQARIQHMPVEIGDLRPAQLHRRAQQVGMPAAGKHRIAVVVNHVARRPPQHHHRHGRGQQHLHTAAQAAGPFFNRPKLGRRPVEGADPLGHFTAPTFTTVGIG